ncbi:DUF1542 domain-containing protein [Staphylococcus epidermidis]
MTQEANNQKTLIGNDGNATDDEKEAAKQLVTQKLNEQIQKFMKVHKIIKLIT